jgi:hypothetical protein
MCALEVGLHPSSFRSHMCTFDAACARRTCFFAHHPSPRITASLHHRITAATFTGPGRVPGCLDYCTSNTADDSSSSMPIAMLSPACTGPTPEGVPVRRRSPSSANFGIPSVLAAGYEYTGQALLCRFGIRIPVMCLNCKARKHVGHDDT